MNKLKMLVLSLIVILTLTVAVLIIVNPSQTNQNNLENIEFEDLFVEDDFPESITEEEALSDFVDLGDLFE